MVIASGRQARLRVAMVIASARQARRRRHTNPIANGGKIGGCARVVAELPADLGPPVEVTCHTVGAALFLNDARDLGRRSVMRNLLLKEIVPPKPSTSSHLSPAP